MPIQVKNEYEIEVMRKANKIVAMTHQLLEKELKPGISTLSLDRIAEEFIRSNGATPSFKGYNGFPASICVSINDEVVHGIPNDKRIIYESDLVSIDIGACYEGYHGDAARTHVMENASDEAKKLTEVTKQSFYEGIKKAKPGNHLHEISSAIQKYVESYGYSVVRDLVGHGIGKEMHEEPQIPNFKPVGRGPKLQKGMTLAIEPMVNAGKYEVRVLSDNWTVVTLDGTLSAHYENTVLITEDGYEILTV